jgi:hypothetical protein
MKINQRYSKTVENAETTKEHEQHRAKHTTAEQANKNQIG